MGQAPDAWAAVHAPANEPKKSPVVHRPVDCEDGGRACPSEEKAGAPARMALPG